jgi:hypothetical protein
MNRQKEVGEPYLWMCKRGHANTHHNLNCFFCGGKQDEGQKVEVR